MDEQTAEIAPTDLRAAVASGLLTEAQAAGLRALAHDRAGKRAAMPAEDEPFEFFRGFGEIFVSVGLTILLSGIGMLLAWISGATLLIVIPAISAAIAWWWATYFTLKRRMNLPSMVLASAYALGVFISAATLLGQLETSPRSVVVLSSLITMAAMALWFRQFRLPFSMFLLGLAGLAAVYGVTGSIDGVRGFGAGFGTGVFDLRNSPQFSVVTLSLNIAAFVAGMWFDTRYPHRLGRHSATAFWLHLLAAPALVNTVAMTLYNIGGSAGMVATTLALVGIAALALVIDRRSFLTAGIVYIALVIAWVIQGGGGDSFGQWIAILLILGALITALGTWWVPLRSTLMRVLPDFPGKSRLPPYASAA